MLVYNLTHVGLKNVWIKVGLNKHFKTIEYYWWFGVILMPKETIPETFIALTPAIV